MAGDTFGLTRRHVVYVQPKRRHPCTNEDGRPKKRWPNPTSAQFVADLATFRGKGNRVIYKCRECDGYHTAHPQRPRAYHRVPERDEARLLEIGLRAVSHERAECHGTSAAREAAVVTRYPRIIRVLKGG